MCSTINYITPINAHLFSVFPRSTLPHYPPYTRLLLVFHINFYGKNKNRNVKFVDKRIWNSSQISILSRNRMCLCVCVCMQAQE